MHRTADIVRPQPLSEAAAAALVEASLGAGVAADFSRACHEVTAGNPFYLRRLIDQLVDDHADPVAEHDDRGSPDVVTKARVTLKR